MKNFKVIIVYVGILVVFFGTLLSASWSYIDKNGCPDTNNSNEATKEQLPMAKGMLIPSYSQLQRDADLIAIAYFKDQKIVKEQVRVNNEADALNIIHSRMSISLVMKGKCDYEEILIRHAEPHLIDKAQKTTGGLKFKELRKWSENNKLIEARPEYLVFLKKSKDDIYDPVTGFVRASLSIREMFDIN